MFDILSLLQCLLFQIDKTTILYDHPVLGLAFFELSLVSVEERHAFPLRTEQVMRTEVKPKPTSSGKGKRGRPAESKNQDKSQVTLNSELRQIKGMITALLTLISGLLCLDYLLLDGKYGNNYAVQMARQVGLKLISKLRHDSQLYLPYEGSDRRCHYGERIRPRQMSENFLVSSSTEDGIRTEIYQVKKALHPILLASILARVANLGAIHPIPVSETSL